MSNRPYGLSFGYCGIKSAASLYPKLLLALASRLAFLVLDYFVAVSDAVAVVRFGNSYRADIRCRLSYEGLVYARNYYFVGAGAFELYACGLGELYGVGKTYVENYLVALLGNLPAYAVYFKALGIALGYAHNHIVEEAL